MYSPGAPGSPPAAWVRKLVARTSIALSLVLGLILSPPRFVVRHATQWSGAGPSGSLSGRPSVHAIADGAGDPTPRVGANATAKKNQSPGRTQSQPSPPPRIIVKMRNEPTEPLTSKSTGDVSLDTLIARFDVQAAVPLDNLERGDPVLKETLGLSRIYVLTLASSSDLQDALSAFSADPAIEYAEPDLIGYGAGMPDDERFDQQWNLHNTGQSGGEPDADVDAPEAWDLSTGITSTVLAIIDTGVDLDHPDLAGKIIPGYDFVNDDGMPQDDHGHGTHVAGIAAASTDNGIGVAGLCPECRIMPLKALDSGNSGYYSWWASAIVYAVDHGANVINMSMGGTGYSQALRDATLYAYAADVPIVAAMMNDGNSTLYYPAAFTETIAVGSTDRYDDRSSFSNYGDHIDLVAPGSAILSTMWDDTYASWYGTSMATPHVAGVLGLVHSVRPGYTVEELRQVLRATADDQVGPPNEDKKGWDRYFGAGRLNAARAVQYVVPPTEVVIDGPATGLTLANHAFTASVSPITAAQPITYVWQATGQSPAIRTGSLSDTITLAWAAPGREVITVTATNFGGAVTSTHIITISAPPPGAILTVCREGGCDYDHIQAAVDAAGDGSIIKVAAGTYTGTNDRGSLAQVVYVSKTVTIRGGYTAPFAAPPNPDAHPTIVDAQGSGRVFYITGGSSPTIDGLRITGGDAAGLGGGQGGDAGGGIYVINATPTISDNLVFGNTAHWGGGLYLRESDATLSGNIITANIASHDGGGLYLWGSHAGLIGNTIASNAASHDGGGMYLRDSDATLSGNAIAANTASHDGGGIYLRGSDTTLINNIVADNRADHAGSGLHIRRSSPHLLHTTIVHNIGGDGSGIHVTDDGEQHSTIVLTNTILVNHLMGITITAGNTVTLEATLWGNAADWGGPGTVITGTNNRWDDPAFVNPTAGDYHIQRTSAAVDAGVDAGISIDIDGQPRPQGDGYDIGADEAPPHPDLAIGQQAAPNPVQAGSYLTYTILVTNTGNETLAMTIVDLLPDQVTPGGTLTWTASAVAPGDVWMESVVVTVQMGYTGPLTNVVQVTTDAGVDGIDTSRVTAVEQVTTIGPSAGGSIVSIGADGTMVAIEAPPGAMTEAAQLGYVSMPTANDSPPGLTFIGYAFRLEAYRNGVPLPTPFLEKPITVTIHYTGTDITGMDENTLGLWYREGGTWSANGITVAERDITGDRLVATSIHLGEFAMFAQTQQGSQTVYLPVVLRGFPAREP